ncbi:uncharacterized protein LOC131931782 [Physella acuta]|uniref:uncharacterized protein LOC131931782 n=1 Tax=Physella acuta TaxID=109671 RepID=UPI0027DD35F0|nr:uncharacterized protein LOC131931782 [Physella acuta]XP_059144593.1 uncharacterized protein LOC131931782 [Physella acuta]XP_059144594.1 uncharacterized protein LOC131931782 [Physella acuta]XP_059144596.1 uncharacterized protein LOC131931782 [Physella acuta]XP_059144597.1 uncharacterized protein LOC131931782 [Physella acuta]XP_059144598.1 uncharacterized protein LOC131931782 [Physella acuta]
MANHDHKRSRGEVNDNQSGVPSKKGRFADIFSKRIDHKEDVTWKEHINDPLFWGPYLAERQWGTVREDYSHDGSCWDYLTHYDATRQAYHWGEDGLLGVSDKFGMLCASLALWNHKDPILKERLFGLTGKEGNHGEDVKELYYYLDNTPRHTYMQALYRYPQDEFPYQTLINHGRTYFDPEYEVLDTGIFDHTYWDVNIEYAKPASHTLICRITITNQSTESAKLDVIPQFLFRNTWSKPGPNKCDNPPLFQLVSGDGVDAIYDMGIFRINFNYGQNVTFNKLLFTENNSERNDFERVESDTDTSRSLSTSTDTNIERIEDKRHVKDAFHRYIIHEETSSVNCKQNGTKCCAWMTADVPGKSKTCVYWQIFPADCVGERSIMKLDEVFTFQKVKATEFYQKVIPREATLEEANICKQAVAGLLWSKQLYIYNMEVKNKELRNRFLTTYFRTSQGKKKTGWNHLTCHDILLVPDKWEFPWFAAWDLAFHCVQFARIDMPFAKEQLLLLLSDRYMHPNGQIPGCEFDLGDPNPPIIGWAVWKMYTMEGKKDLPYLKTCFNRLIFSFQWWHKMDPTNSYLYGHGFMGMDNISLVDRSSLPPGMTGMKQADTTGWMGLFSLTMLQIALELCKHDNSYTDMAIKFLKHFLHIARAINRSFSEGGLWDEEDKFFYDVVHYQDPHNTPIRLRSWTGIVPLLACCSVDLKLCPLVKTFLLRCDKGFSPFVCKLGENEFFLTLVSYTKLKMMLKIVFSEQEFLSPFGIRSLSKAYENNPLIFDIGDIPTSVSYLPGESDTNMFGGNSNWRGPVWLPMNYLFIECLEKYGDLDRVFTIPLSIQYPTGATSKSTFLTISRDLCKRLVSIFLPDAHGERPVHGSYERYGKDPDWKSLVLFYEYIHADTGRGCGASHQTGWSALVIEFIYKLHNMAHPATETLLHDLFPKPQATVHHRNQHQSHLTKF